jgi:pimeloyl-ACP methyl ester carboxylesterase
VTVREFEVAGAQGRTLHAYDAGGEGERLAVFWHHGTPNLGAPPQPLFAAADRLGLRWVSYDRPGYGGSTPRPDRDIASAAQDTAAVADALGLSQFAVMGHSGGGPHALACAALLPDRVVAAVSGAGMAPLGAPGLDWFAGMGASGVASLRAAVAGREAKELHEHSGVEYDNEFCPADLTALHGDWSWFDSVVGPAVLAGPAALIDDDLAYVRPWGFDPTTISAPVLLLHGGLDRMIPSAHSVWLAEHLPNAQVRLYPDDGHISVLRHAGPALEWLRAQAG